MASDWWRLLKTITGALSSILYRHFVWICWDIRSCRVSPQSLKLWKGSIWQSIILLSGGWLTKMHTGWDLTDVMFQYNNGPSIFVFHEFHFQMEPEVEVIQFCPPGPASTLKLTVIVNHNEIDESQVKPQVIIWLYLHFNLELYSFLGAQDLGSIFLSVWAPPQTLPWWSRRRWILCLCAGLCPPSQLTAVFLW